VLPESVSSDIGLLGYHILYTSVQSTKGSSFIDEMFPDTAAQAWNRLPSLLQEAPLLTIFRYQLTTHFLLIAFVDLLPVPGLLNFHCWH
jgi:hypothetical protein